MVTEGVYQYPSLSLLPATNQSKQSTIGHPTLSDSCIAPMEVTTALVFNQEVVDGTAIVHPKFELYRSDSVDVDAMPQ